jgi:hypothetical protein
MRHEIRQNKATVRWFFIIWTSLFMQAFLLNFTRILEKNPKVYISIIMGIVGCVMLFVAEAVHIQKVVEALATKDQTILRAAVQPLSDRYGWARIGWLFVMFVWSTLQYSKTKKALGL